MTCASFLGVNFRNKANRRKRGQNLSKYRSVHSSVNNAKKLAYKELLSLDVTFNLSAFEVGCDHWAHVYQAWEQTTENRLCLWGKFPIQMKPPLNVTDI